MAKLIPSVTVSRLGAYLRALTAMEAKVDYVTSEELGAATNVSAHQVRKDLVHAEASGTRGRGYTVAILRRELSSILGLTRKWNVAIVGMGRLGQALADTPYFRDYNFQLRCGFDVDPAKVGHEFGGLPTYAVSQLAERVPEFELDLAVLTVPVAVAQPVADAVTAAGIRGILNFTPKALSVPDGVRVEPIDFVAGLKRLAYYLQPEPAPTVD